MIKITLKDKLFLIGKAEEILEAIDDMLVKYGENAKIADIIEHSLKA